MSKELKYGIIKISNLRRKEKVFYILILNKL